MEIKVRVTPEDFAEAFRVHYTRNPVRKWSFILIKAVLLLIVCVIVLGLLVSRSSEDLANLAPLLIVLIVWLFLLTWGLSIFAKVRWRKTPSAKLEQTFTFTEGGYSCRTDISEGRANWEHVLQWTESKDLFLLYTGPGIFMPIPKRFFLPEQTGEFRALVKRHVKHA